MPAKAIGGRDCNIIERDQWEGFEAMIYFVGIFFIKAC